MKTRYEVLDPNPAADPRGTDAACQRLRLKCGDVTTDDLAAADLTYGPAAARLAMVSRAEAMPGRPSPQGGFDRLPPARARPAVRGVDARWPLTIGILALAIGGAAGIGWLVLNARDRQAAVLAGLQATTQEQASALAQQNQVQLQVQLESERLKAMVELTRRDQDLRAKALDRDTALAERELALRERNLSATEADRALERTHRAAELSWAESDRRVYELENAARIERENAATRLGVTDAQYEQLREVRGSDLSGLR